MCLRMMLCRFAPNAGAATSPAGANGSSVYFLDRFYDNVHVERKGVTSLDWPKPKLKFSFNKKVSLNMQHGTSLAHRWLHGLQLMFRPVQIGIHAMPEVCWHWQLQLLCLPA